MNHFPYAHATHPQWRMAAALVLAQLRAQMALPGFAATPTLALLYITDHYADVASALLEHLGAELPWVTDWSGTVGLGIASNNVEYFDEPALAVMLLDVPSDQYRVFSGVAPLGLGFAPHTALVHADPETPDLADLVEELAGRTDAGYVFGGISSSRARSVQFAVAGDGNISGHGAVSGVFSGGLSGVAFGPGVGLVSRVTQGCKPVSAPRRVTQADRNLVVALDGEAALDVMLQDLQASPVLDQQAIDLVRATMVGLVQPVARALRMPPRSAELGGGAALEHTGDFGSDVLVRHIIGLDPERRGIAVSDIVQTGATLTFCQRNTQAARADLMRICAEIREALEPTEMAAHTMQDALADTARVLAGRQTETTTRAARQIAGAVYASCCGRGGPHFGGPSAEMQIVRRALGDVPLVGFFGSGEIAGAHLYGYTGVLTVFTADT